MKGFSRLPQFHIGMMVAWRMLSKTEMTINFNSILKFFIVEVKYAFTKLQFKFFNNTDLEPMDLKAKFHRYQCFHGNCNSSNSAHFRLSVGNHPTNSGVRKSPVKIIQNNPSFPQILYEILIFKAFLRNKYWHLKIDLKI